MSEATDITRKARSNLAFALQILPKDRREDAIVFYAFCRVIDDLADDLSLPLEARQRGLQEWLEGLSHGFPQPDELQREVLALRERRDIPVELFQAIVEGCRMDLAPQRFETWDDLSQYTWRVACAVGLIAMRIFGAKDPATEEYAVALGHALQITNIIRDVGEDLDNEGRIYLPLADLRQFGYAEDDLIARTHDERFLGVMRHQAARAREFYAKAGSRLPEDDRRAMVAAEIMREIYGTLLEKIERDGFRVFDRHYRLSKARKMAIFSKYLMRLGPLA